MENKSIEELSFNELRVECKKKNIDVNKGDNKAVLISKLKTYAENMATRSGKLVNISAKMKDMVKVIVTKNDPEDTREAMVSTIVNATGTYSWSIPFNTKIDIPRPFVKKLKSAKIQKFNRIIDKDLGPIDRPYEDSKYIVQELS